MPYHIAPNFKEPPIPVPRALLGDWRAGSSTYIRVAKTSEKEAIVTTIYHNGKGKEEIHSGLARFYKSANLTIVDIDVRNYSGSDGGPRADGKNHLIAAIDMIDPVAFCAAGHLIAADDKGSVYGPDEVLDFSDIGKCVRTVRDKDAIASFNIFDYRSRDFYIRSDLYDSTYAEISKLSEKFRLEFPDQVIAAQGDAVKMAKANEGNEVKVIPQDQIARFMEEHKMLAQHFLKFATECPMASPTTKALFKDQGEKLIFQLFDERTMKALYMAETEPSPVK